MYYNTVPNWEMVSGFHCQLDRQSYIILNIYVNRLVPSRLFNIDSVKQCPWFGYRDHKKTNILIEPSKKYLLLLYNFHLGKWGIMFKCNRILCLTLNLV